jgi:pimeloyl-ACP methyl ester carboxylesterase
MERLSETHHVLAADSYGSGKSAEWRSDRKIALRDEVDFLEPVLVRAGSPLVLVGHSYGAAVALIAALSDPRRVRALALYEPTLFSLVDANASSPNGVKGIRDTVLAAGVALDAGDRDAAAGHFIDYWMGTGSWSAIPPQRKPAITDSIVNVRRWGHALFTETTPASAFAALDIPILYMMGESSPESAHAVAQALMPALPRVRVVEFPGLGHMAPVTDPQRINAEIAKFLSEV